MLTLDFNKLDYLTNQEETAKYFLLPENKQENIWEDVGILNQLLKETATKLPCIDAENLYIDYINFDHTVKAVGPIQYTFAFETPKTRTGRIPKYPTVISFSEYLDGDLERLANQNTFGKIYYLSSGQIGKARAVFWREHHCYVAEFRTAKSNELYLWRIHTRQYDHNTLILFENSENG